MSITNSLLHTAYRRARKPTEVIITVYLSALLLLIAITVTSCSKKADISTTPSFLFGTSYGECAGDCDTYFAISGNNVYSTTGRYIPGPLEIGRTPLSQEKYQLAKELMDALPVFLVTKTTDSQTFGCPDCHDQGGIHIEYMTEESIIKWHIDTDTTALTSPELRRYAVRMMDVIAELDKQ